MDAMLRAQDLRSVVFPMVRRGYEPEVVDRLIDAAVVALAAHESGRAAALTAAEVDATRFPSPRTGSRGYGPEAVDDVLDALAATLRHYEGGSPSAAPQAPLPGASAGAPTGCAAPVSAVVEGDATRRKPFWRRRRP